MDAQSARSLVLELLSAVPDGLPVGALIGGSEVMGVSSNGVRVALSRLKAQSLIEGAGRGFYRLGPAALAVQRVVAGWREVEARVGDWDGSWLAVHSAAVPKSARRAARNRARALRLLGFRELSRDLHMRPDNLCASIADTRARLRELGLDAREMVFGVHDLGDEAAALALWDGEAINAGYVSMTARLTKAEGRLAKASVRRAAREAFLLGSEGIRRIVADPLLPAPIVDTRARAAFFAAMRRFDAFGRDKWRQLLSDEVKAVA